MVGVVLCAQAWGAERGESLPVGLKTEMMSEPIMLDTAKPRFSWRVEDARPGARQMAYEVQAGSSAENLEHADLWDSGKVTSGQSHLVTYGGKTLNSRERVWWRVRTWDQEAKASPWSALARFEIALLNGTDWKAKWICAPVFAPVNNDATALWSRMVVIPTATEEPLKNVDAATKERLQKEWEEALAEIRPAPLFRKSFSLGGKVKAARLYSCGLGFHEVTINGQRVDDALMSPAESHYPVYAHYVVRDVTRLLREGENVIGVLLGNGRYYEKLTYSRKCFGEDLPLIAQLEVETDKGKVMITSDETWQCTPSPLLKNNFWVSEAWDARREMRGFDAPGFDAAGWKAAQEIAAPTKKLEPDMIPPERVKRRIRPVAVTEPHEGVWVFDMGELIVGCAELNVRVPAGTALTMRYGEQIFGPDIPGSLLHYDGFDNKQAMPGMLSSKSRGNGVLAVSAKDHPYFHSLTSADVYVARGEPGGETWHARFAYHPFRYVELTGYPGAPTADAISGLVINNDLATTGTFESSDPMLNRIYEAATHSADYDTHGSICDNPGTEKQNGLTPAISCGVASVYFRDVAQLWRKLLDDTRAVTPPSMEPMLLGSGLRIENFRKPVTTIWTRSSVELPWYYRLHLGDESNLGEAYSYMKGYVDFWTKDFISEGKLPADRFGDHMDFSTAYNKPAPICTKAGVPSGALSEVRYLTDPGLIGAAYVIGMTRIVANAAALLGKSDDAGRYASLADKMTSQFNAQWFIPERNAYGRRPPAYQFTIQGGSAIALYFDLVPAEKREAVVDALALDVEAWGGISTGMGATYPLFEVLARNGHADLALKVMTQTNYPGPGHSLGFGTKTMPEVWALPNRPSNASLVQSEYAWVARWFFAVLCGINPDPAEPGFKHFFLEPVMPEKLAFASCETETPYGEIVSSWKKEGGTVRWNITIPWNSSATVKLPQVAAGKIMLQGKPVEKDEFELTSGRWEVRLGK